MFEGGSPNALVRHGFTKNSLPKGTKVIVEGFQAKDGSNRANGRDIMLPDGRAASSRHSAEREEFLHRYTCRMGTAQNALGRSRPPAYLSGELRW
jgi:hypothetical protein